MFNFSSTTLRVYAPPEEDEALAVADFATLEDLDAEISTILATDRDWLTVTRDDDIVTITSLLDTGEFRWTGEDLAGLAGLFGVGPADVEVVDGLTVEIINPTANWRLIPDLNEDDQ